VPPDYLNEKEKAIFDRLNEALEPVALQVRLPMHSHIRQKVGLDLDLKSCLTCVS
jgi:hypothetical protein